jgi:hypothetical protein
MRSGYPQRVDAEIDDDTVVRAPAVPVRPAGPDLDDTITTAARPAMPPAPPVSAPVPPTAAPTLAPVTAPIVLPAAETEPDPVPTVRMPDGTVVEVEAGTVYVGRRPTLPRVPASGVPTLVTVDSPGREVSSTHIAISAVGGAIVVRDMLSTNGTVVKTPGVPARTLLRGESAVVVPGTTLDLGDGNVIEVLV